MYQFMCVCKIGSNTSILIDLILLLGIILDISLRGGHSFISKQKV